MAAYLLTPSNNRPTFFICLLTCPYFVHVYIYLSIYSPPTTILSLPLSPALSLLLSLSKVMKTLRQLFFTVPFSFLYLSSASPYLLDGCPLSLSLPLQLTHTHTHTHTPRGQTVRRCLPTQRRRVSLTKSVLSKRDQGGFVSRCPPGRH